jgi:DNA-binding response OmpR family regulator
MTPGQSGPRKISFLRWIRVRRLRRRATARIDALCADLVRRPGGQGGGGDTGADAYRSRPFELEELVARIENLIATRRALRASFRAGGGDGAGRGAQAEALGLKTKGLKNAAAAGADRRDDRRGGLLLRQL